jgi:hypothetical protein
MADRQSFVPALTGLPLRQACCDHRGKYLRCAGAPLACSGLPAGQLLELDVGRAREEISDLKISRRDHEGQLMMASWSTPETVWDCLERPGISVIRSAPNVTTTAKVLPLGANLEAAVPSRQKPTHAYHDPDFLDQLYTNVKRDTQRRFPHLTHLPPSVVLQGLMSLKADDVPQRNHYDKTHCLGMDRFDLVKPTLQAVLQISGQRLSELDVTTDFVIYQRQGGGDGTPILVLEYKSLSVGAALYTFRDCIDLAQQRPRLDYADARKASGNEANKILVKVSQAACPQRVAYIQLKLGLCMKRDEVKFGILSNDEHLVFCELLEDASRYPVLRLSKVYPCTNPAPTVSSTLAALLLDILGTASVQLPPLRLPAGPIGTQ